MTRPGPSPKPTILKAAAGNPGKRRLNENEPVPPPGEIEPPAWLNSRGREIWDRISPIAKSMQVLTTADAMTFARYCDTFGRWLDLKDQIQNKFGGQTTYTRFDDKGRIQYVAEIPQVARQAKLEQLLIRYEEEFGLTPAARTRIHVEMTAGPRAQPSAEDEKKREFFRTRGMTA